MGKRERERIESEREKENERKFKEIVEKNHANPRARFELGTKRKKENDSEQNAYD